MIYKLLIIMWFAVCTAIPRASAEDMDLPKLAKETRPSVVLLAVYDSDGNLSATGTGFFVSADGKLLTSLHVIKGAASVVAKTDDDKIYEIKRVLARYEDLDLALLQADTTGVPYLNLGEEGASEVGQRVAVIGSPLGLDGTLSEGIISAKRQMDDGSMWLQITAAISPGSSGSPVMNAKGDVIGVATMVLTGGQALNFAVSVGVPRKMPTKNTDEPPTQAAASAAPAPVDIPDDDVDPAYQREHPLSSDEVSKEDTPLGRKVKQEISDTGSPGEAYKHYLMKFWKRGS
jgi:hypothetical protein